MSTAIAIDESTMELLTSIKVRENFASYSEVVQHLAETHQDTAAMFGITKDNPLRFTKNDELKFHEV